MNNYIRKPQKSQEEKREKNKKTSLSALENKSRALRAKTDFPEKIPISP